MSEKSLWELLWDYDPNGLVVADSEMRIATANPAFCAMLNLDLDTVTGRSIGDIFPSDIIFREVLRSGEPVRDREVHFSECDLYVRQIVFPVPSRELVACILVDITEDYRRRQEMQRLKKETILQVNGVVDQQMKVAQEIASLLGETTANTKTSLLRVARMLEQEDR